MSRDLGFPIATDAEAKSFIQFDTKGIRKTDALTLRERPLGSRTLADEDTAPPAPDEALGEAGRCLNCGCLAVNSSDIATALMSLDAKIKTNKKIYSAEAFFSGAAKVADLLDQDELVTEIVLPPQPAGSKLAFAKFRERESIDFAVVSVASAYEVESGKIKSAKVVLGAAAPAPIRAVAAEEFLKGKEFSQGVAERAADLAVEGAKALEKNEYKIQIAKTLVKRSIFNDI